MARPKKVVPVPVTEETVEPVTSKVNEARQASETPKLSSATLREMEAGRKALIAKMAREK